MTRSPRLLAFGLLLLVSSLAWAEGAEKAPSPLFPLPSLDGKPLAASDGQKVFRVPLRMARVEKFYRDRFATDSQVTLSSSEAKGHRAVTLVSRRKTDAWTKAVIREGEMETVIEITPVLRFAGDHVQGNGRPLVEFILTRSDEARKMVEQIDHMEK